jgi:hypothetical protein
MDAASDRIIFARAGEPDEHIKARLLGQRALSEGGCTMWKSSISGQMLFFRLVPR